MLDKIATIASSIFSSNKRKKPSMSFDSLVEMANNINHEIIENANLK